MCVFPQEISEGLFFHGKFQKVCFSMGYFGMYAFPWKSSEGMYFHVCISIIFTVGVQKACISMRYFGRFVFHRRIQK